MCNENGTCGESMVAQDTAVAMITEPHFKKYFRVQFL